MENWKRIQIEHIHGNELLLNEIVCFYFRNDFVCFLLLKDQGYLAERFTNVALLRRDIRIKQTIIKLAGPNKCIHYCAHHHHDWSRVNVNFKIYTKEIIISVISKCIHISTIEPFSSNK